MKIVSVFFSFFFFRLNVKYSRYWYEHYTPKVINLSKKKKVLLFLLYWLSSYNFTVDSANSVNTHNEIWNCLWLVLCILLSFTYLFGCYWFDFSFVFVYSNCLTHQMKLIAFFLYIIIKHSYTHLYAGKLVLLQYLRFIYLWPI